MRGGPWVVFDNRVRFSLGIVKGTREIEAERHRIEKEKNELLMTMSQYTDRKACFSPLRGHHSSKTKTGTSKYSSNVHTSNSLSHYEDKSRRDERTNRSRRYYQHI